MPQHISTNINSSQNIGWKQDRVQVETTPERRWEGWNGCFYSSIYVSSLTFTLDNISR